MICVIDYGLGNLRSVSKALEKLGGEVRISSNPQDLETADKLVLPGVGAFGHGMRELKTRGLVEPLKIALGANRPFLGICLGMQLLFEESEESPGVPGLGILAGRVVRFKSPQLKIPHMGWNAVSFSRGKSPLFEGVTSGSHFYFVHSYYAVPKEDGLVWGSCEYGNEKFPAVIGKNSLWAAQFHPEKSQEAGLRILKNFLDS